ncbi:uncharacterized protein VP01_862g3 [Puccinia sorghi]|uniref:Uncharacterized protein n=1 Tax=Puccinia sorghi TaxID=27349 RepID=A0A0L6U8U4_9BASI|nr:uncharacterized protein VP01_862g3 [Puccinia sorghi]
MITTKLEFPLNFCSSTQKQRTQEIPNKLNLLLIDNIQSHSHFIQLNLIINALKAQTPIIIINLNQTTHYWHTLLQKQGIQPQSNQYKNLFKSIQILPNQPIQQLIKHELEQNKQQQQPPPLIIIDDLTSIIWATDRSSDNLIHEFYSILPSELDLDFSLVLTFHDDLLQSNQRDREVLQHIINRSHIIIRTRALGAQGQGELIIQRGPGYTNDLDLPITLSTDQTTQFKIIDNSVTFHPKGLDKGFI